MVYFVFYYSHCACLYLFPAHECNCEVIARFDLDDITYIALLPEEDEDSDIIVYRYTEDGDEVDLGEITDEEEFNKVADALDEILDDLEFNSED